MASHDGKHFLYSNTNQNPALGGTYFASLDGRENRLVVAGNTVAMYAIGEDIYTLEKSGTLYRVDAIKEKRYDVILMDVQMPIMVCKFV